MNIERRHTNIQKGVQQNGIGHKNLQKDEMKWRRGRTNTVDVQENVKQNGIGKRNNKSLRRINEMMRKLFDHSKPRRKRPRYGKRLNRNKEKAIPYRRSDNQKRRKVSQNKNQSEILKESTKALQYQVNTTKVMLCKSIAILCNENDRSTRRAMNTIAQDNITQVGDRNVNSQLSVIQNASPPRYKRRRPSILDTYDEIIFLPYYEIVLK